MLFIRFSEDSSGVVQEEDFLEVEVEAATTTISVVEVEVSAEADHQATGRIKIIAQINSH